MKPDIPFSLHHVGYLSSDLQESVRLFTERFGYLLESDVVEDTVQSAYVQLLRLPGSTSWLELVSPNGPASKLQSALKKKITLHHLCYEVDDIERAGVELREQGMLPLHPPAPARLFGGRRISWFMDVSTFLVELVENGPGPFTLGSIRS